MRAANRSHFIATLTLRHDVAECETQQATTLAHPKTETLGSPRLSFRAPNGHNTTQVVNVPYVRRLVVAIPDVRDGSTNCA